MRIATSLRLTAALVLLLAPLTAAAEPHHLELDPEETTIDFHLGATGHDVEGSFALDTGRLRFDPETGSATGEIVIDATVAETGKPKRDRTMHLKVLETEVYPTFTFRADRFEGELRLAGDSEIDLVGTLAIHGDDHPFVLPARVHIEGDRVTAETDFEIPFVEWGMKDPSLLFLRVEKSVAVHVVARGELLSAPSAPTGN